MNRSSYRIAGGICLACLIALSLVCSVSSLASDWESRPGTAAYARSLPDGTPVVLDAMVVNRFAAPYCMVKDWGTDSLPIYVRAASIERWWSLEITGRTATVGGQRIIVATRVRRYDTANGGAFFMFPKSARQPDNWPYKSDIPLGSSPTLANAASARTMADNSIPPVPVEGNPQPAPPLVLTSGTIPWAKTQTSSVSLTGKVVSAVFLQMNSSDIDYFYIQEPGGFRVAGSQVGGIRVTASSYPSGLAAGKVVSITGTVSVVNGECTLAASSVTITGETSIPAPVGMPGRAVACGEWGLQPALATDPTASPNPTMGHGLSPVGCRVRLFGKVTWINTGRTECCIDDGSALIPGVADGVKGIRLMYPSGYTCPTELVTGYYVSKGVTGVLGAETVGGVPVPVLRVPMGVIHVATNGSDNNDGLTWTTAKQTVQAGIDAAFATQPKSEVWVAAGEYDVWYYDQHTLTLKDGVAVYGGFAGGESTRGARDPKTCETKLTMGCDAATVTAVNVGMTSVLDGFTIADGNYPGVQCENASPVIANNHITGMTYIDKGAGIFCTGTGTPTIVDNIIENNAAVSYNNNSGGGIYCEECSPVIERNILRGNSAYFGGAIYCNSGGRIADNVIIDNTAVSGNGGGIYVGSTSPLVTNNTIVNNTASAGGGIYIESGAPALVNNIVALNSSGIWRAGTGAVVIHNNDVYKNGEQDYYGWTPNPAGNLSVDPQFMGDDEYHIAVNSPCAGVGDNGFVMKGIDLDIDREPRVKPENGVVDIGADESDNCGWHLTLTAPERGPFGTQVTATVTGDGGVLINGAIVDFATSGAGSVNPSESTTVNGIATTYLYGPAGRVVVTATVIDQCGQPLTASTVVWLFDSAPDDWPMFMHDPQHTGMSNTWDDTGETLTRQWVATVPTSNVERGVGWADHPNRLPAPTRIFYHPYIDSSPVVVGKMVVVGAWESGDYYTGTGSVKAFHAEDGTPAWTAVGDPAMGGVASTPCIADGRVYVGASNGYLYCLSLSDGHQLWARPTTDRSAAVECSRIISSPVVYSGVVYITNEASKIYAFTADDNGTLVEGYPIVLPIDQPDHGITQLREQNLCGASSPAIAVVGSNTYLLVGCDDAFVYRINLADRSLAELCLGGCVESSPSVRANNAYVGVSICGGRNLWKLTIADPVTEEFETTASWMLGQESRATPSLAYEYVYNGVDTGHTFYKLDTAVTGNDNGALVEFNLRPDHSDYFVGSAAHTAYGIVYTGNDDGHFYALHADDLTEIIPGGYYDSSIQTPGFVCSSPSIGYNVDDKHNRWVFITTRSDGGRLYAFKTVRLAQ